MPEALRYVIVCVAAYLLGSISSGILLSRFRHGPNLREVGSKNTGASNVLRTMGVRDGLITFFGDVSKALLACGIGWWFIGLHGAMAAGLCVILGHNWPIFFQFRGGKGVASSCAVLLMCFPVPALISFAVAIVVIAITRFISLGSMSMLLCYAILIAVQYWGNWLVVGWAVILCALCIFRHHGNIGRLIHGKERKIGEKA